MTRQQLRTEQQQARADTGHQVLIGGRITFVSPGHVALCAAPSGREYTKDERGVMRRLTPKRRRGQA